MISKGNLHFRITPLIDQYLQPLPLASNGYRLPFRQKATLKDGYIEREIHGAMHASRVCAYVPMLHQLLAEIDGSYIEHSLGALAESLNLTREQVMLLTRIAAFGHDSQRQNEATDIWERQSAKAIKAFLTEEGYADKVSTAFAQIAVNKDRPNLLKQKVSLPPDAFKGLDYCRLLLSLADCFDMIRCNGEFRFENIQKKLECFSAYQADTHGAVFFEFAKQVHALLARQHDVYFKTRLINPQGKTEEVAETTLDYSLQAKVAFEHAPNPLSATVHFMQQQSYFRPLLEGEALANTCLATVPPAYRPLLHGTDSRALLMTSMTNHQLMSVFDQLARHNLAPMTGELTKGGFSQASNTGELCFARLGGKPGSWEYTLEKIINTYAKPRAICSLDATYNDLTSAIQSLPKQLGSNINLVLIYLARFRLLGGDLSTIPNIDQLNANIEAALDVFALYLLLGKHLRVKRELLAKLEKNERQDHIDAYSTHFTAENLIAKFNKKNLNIREIVANPSAENLQKVIEILVLPQKSVIKSGLMCVDKNVTLSHTQLFEIGHEPLDTPYLSDPWQSLSGAEAYVLNNAARTNHTTSELLAALVAGRLSQASFADIADELKTQIAVLTERHNIKKRLCSPEARPLDSAITRADLYQNPVPVVFIYNRDEYIRIGDFKTQEYRAEAPLTLGTDIIQVATDTPANQRQLQAYFAKRQLGVDVVLFSQLYKAREALYASQPPDLEVHAFANPSPLQQKGEKLSPSISTTLQNLIRTTQSSLSRNTFLYGQQSKHQQFTNLLQQASAVELTKTDCQTVLSKLAGIAAKPRGNVLSCLFAPAHYAKTRSYNRLLETLLKNKPLLTAVYGKALLNNEALHQKLFNIKQTDSNQIGNSCAHQLF